jgi:hypothetical protein
MPVAPKSAVWVTDPDKHGFVEAVVVSCAGGKVKVEFPSDARYQPTPDAKTKAPKTDYLESEVFERLTTERTPVSEMDNMSILNQAEVLDNVHVLFQQGMCENLVKAPI